MPEQLNNIAVLIDADNASVKNIGHILQEIEKYGVIGCKKIYGDWSNAHIQSWQEALLKYAIDPMQQFAYVKGKNATDIGMVIEAMDLLHSGEYDGFCLISSDSDFTSLALRIRKNGVKVFGFGKSNTVSAFRQACDGFFCVEDLVAKSNTKENKKSATNQTNNTNSSTRWTTSQLHTQSHLIGVINKLFHENPNNDNGWTDISYIAKQINQNHPNIKLDKYGYKKFSDLITAIRLYDIKRDKSRVLIKLKTKKQNHSTQPKTSNHDDINSHSNTTTNSNDKPSSINSPNETSQHTANIFPASPVNIQITTASTTDTVLFRVNKNGKVRGDEDMIFYGQTYSEDNSIILDQIIEADKSNFNFECNLITQPNSIQHMVFVLSSELETLVEHNQQSFIQVIISHTQNNNILFSKKFDLAQKIGKSLLLFTLSRQADTNNWKFSEQNKVINGDLHFVCEKFGVEISYD